MSLVSERKIQIIGTDKEGLARRRDAWARPRRMNRNWLGKGIGGSI